jgi:hypothetical protein
VRRALLIAVLTLVAVPASAAAQQVCKVPGPEARGENRILEQIRQRERYGFRADRAYVESLQASGVVYRSLGDLRVTPEEARYLDRRRALRLGAPATRYLRRHERVSAWWDVRDDWPRGAYVAVFIADDPARHRAAIKRLAASPRFTRVVRVRYSDRELERVRDRIDRDEARLRRAGFTAAYSETEAGTDRVDVTVITRRTDAAAYFKRRYGPMVRTIVIARSRSLEGCVDVDRFEIAPDGLTLTLSWSNAGPPERFEVSERADRVVIGVVERVRVDEGFGEESGSGEVKLGAPLGDRAVYDANDGSRMLQSGPSPGAPPCPAPREQLTPIEQAVLERERYGMNTDPAYVQSLLDDDRTYTEHERRWLKSVGRLDREQDVDDYVWHWSEDWGGTTVVARYPERPYLVVRLLRRVAFHAQRIRRLSKDDVRIVRSTVQRDFFYELPQNIGDDAGRSDGFLDGYGRNGFYVAGAEGDESEQVVDVKVITARTDAASWFARVYGPLVRVEVIGDRFECRGSYSGA